MCISIFHFTSSLVALEDLNLGQNKFDAVPECLYNLPAVCNLIISNNQIRTVEVRYFTFLL